MTASKNKVTGERALALLALTALFATSATAQAQDTRRRPGDTVTDERAIEPPRQTAPVATPEPTPEPAPVRPAMSERDAAYEEIQRREVSSPDIGGRRRPGQPEYTRPTATGERVLGSTPTRADRKQIDPNRRSGLARIEKPSDDAVFAKEVVTDRWRLTQALGLTDFPLWDPYNQNTLKADRPVHGDWFFNLTLISDTVVEPRRLPIPVAPQGEDGTGSFGLIGDTDQLLLAQNFGVGLVYYKGNTTFMPPDWEFRFTPVINVNRAQVEQNRALRIDPREGTTRNDDHVGIQELFIDKHLYDVTTRYDFDSVRVGIQPFNADFRGFLFRDQQLGFRWFGNRNNNVFQYNVGWFRRLEKDTNSGLNDLGQPIRKDDVFIANLYWQDFPVLGFIAEALVLHNSNREGSQSAHFNQNGFIERPFSFGIEKPRSYEVTYFGLAGDGHLGRLNLSVANYYALGSTSRGVFVDQKTDIAAYFLAAELSIDHDWQRYRLSFLYASGDDDPFDDVETGFDAVFENALFAGADTNFWLRQNVPLIGGGGVAISSRNGILNSLRSSKEEGQSNFTNPGTILLGIGADFDITPQWRLSGNVNEIAFATTEVVETARQQAGVSRRIGTDVSLAAIWRPKFSQNIVLRASGAALVPGTGYKQLFGDEVPYSVLVNLTLTW